jgi:hypothetical protein
LHGQLKAQRKTEILRCTSRQGEGLTALRYQLPERLLRSSVVPAAMFDREALPALAGRLTRIVPGAPARHETQTKLDRYLDAV